MHQNHWIICCIVAPFKTNPENTRILSFYSNSHQALLTIFPTLLFVIWYIYPPTRPVLLSVLDVIPAKERKELAA